MRSRSSRWFSVGRILAMAVVAMSTTQSAKAEKRPSMELPAFRADSALVLVPVNVVDRRGAIVNGLARNAFLLTEDGVEQQIRSFSEEDAPVSMGIVLDLSGSMKRSLGAAKQALRALLEDANPGDEAFLNAVSTRPRAYSGFTRDFDEILHRVAFENAAGSTALIDALYDSLKELRAGVHPRKALLVISDGMDNHSRYTSKELRELAVESDAQIYTIAPGDASAMAPFGKAMALSQQRQGLQFFDELAARTGGIAFVVRDQKELAKAVVSIGHALRNQYTIGYVPHSDGRKAEWRRIKVKVAGSGLRAYARAGYRPD